jgi:hypothetical protein
MQMAATIAETQQLGAQTTDAETPLQSRTGMPRATVWSP